MNFVGDRLLTVSSVNLGPGGMYYRRLLDSLSPSHTDNPSRLNSSG